MSTNDFFGMLDRAEILFRARDNLRDIAHQAIRISAIVAMEFFYKIEIVKMMTVIDEIIATLHLFNAIDWEACKLIKADENIRNDQWDNHGVYDRASNQILRSVSDQPAKKIPSEFAVRLLDGLFKLNLLTIHME